MEGPEQWESDPKIILKMIKEYTAKYIAYNNKDPKDTGKYFNFSNDLCAMGFSPHSSLLRGRYADSRIIDAYAALKLAKVTKIERWVLSGDLDAKQQQFCMFSIKNLGVSDEYIDDITLRRERLEIERERLLLSRENVTGDLGDYDNIKIGFDS